MASVHYIHRLDGMNLAKAIHTEGSDGKTYTQADGLDRGADGYSVSGICSPSALPP